MTKQEILDKFNDINFVYNDSSKHETLSRMLDELLKEREKGEWIDHTFAYGDDIECPFCHKKWNVIDNCTETFDYCPGCGAKLT